MPVLRASVAITPINVFCWLGSGNLNTALQWAQECGLRFYTSSQQDYQTGKSPMFWKWWTSASATVLIDMNGINRCTPPIISG